MRRSGCAGVQASSGSWWYSSRRRGKGADFALRFCSRAVFLFLHHRDSLKSSSGRTFSDFDRSIAASSTVRARPASGVSECSAAQHDRDTTQRLSYFSHQIPQLPDNNPKNTTTSALSRRHEIPCVYSLAKSARLLCARNANPTTAPELLPHIYMNFGLLIDSPSPRPQHPAPASPSSRRDTIMGQTLSEPVVEKVRMLLTL